MASRSPRPRVAAQFGWRLVTWLAGLAAIVALSLLALRAIGQRQLEQDAEQVALGYARLIALSVPDVDLIFESGRIDHETRTELNRLRIVGDVFRFKLFDRTGRQLLVSDDLDRSDPVAASAGQRLGLDLDHPADAAARILDGHTEVVLMDGGGRPDRPATYVEAYVPYGRDSTGKALGVIEIYLDQTVHAAHLKATFARVAAVIGGVMLLLGLAIAAQAALRARERREANTRLRFLARHDVLSGALNRASFHEALQQAAWRQTHGGPAFALLCIDLDRFKEVNDTLGHAAGDDVLRAATERLRKLIRRGDALARLGGDEFAILQGAVASADDVAVFAQRVVDAMAAPFSTGGQQIGCGASVGAARFGVDANEVDDLLRKADVAMYRAKTGGRGRFSFYDADLDQQLAERRTLARELRDSVAADGLSMHYQPQFAADGTTLLGYEALMRWQHPTRGMVPPSEFIPLAEQSGLIEELGEFALRRACADAVGWPLPLTVSVNLSAAQFHGEKDLADVVRGALAAAGLPATRLELEITESLLMNETETVVQKLGELSATGVRIAMDDFGTGYSSLAYLWRFPFDKVKIDRAFTQSLGSDDKVALIVRSIVSLSHSMGIRVNAEGVETAPQMALLKSLGCDELQGYLLGRPAPEQQLSHAGVGAQAGHASERPLAPRLEDILTLPSPL